MRSTPVGQCAGMNSAAILLHPIVGGNRFCVPAALAALTGKTTDEAAEAISAVSPCVRPKDVGSVLRETVWDAMPYLGIDAAADCLYRDPPDLWDWAHNAEDGRWLVGVIRDLNDHAIAFAKRGDDMAAMDWTRPSPSQAATPAAEMRGLGHREDGQCRVRWAWPIVSYEASDGGGSGRPRADRPRLVFHAVQSRERALRRLAIQDASRSCGARPLGLHSSLTAMWRAPVPDVKAASSSVPGRARAGDAVRPSKTA